MKIVKKHLTSLRIYDTIYSANDPWDLIDDIDDMFDWIVFNIIGEQETVHEIMMKLSE